MRFERTCSGQKGTVLGMEGPRRESTVAGKAERPFFIATVLSTSLKGESSHKPQRDRDREGSSPQVKYVQFTLGDTDFLGNLPAQERHHQARMALTGQAGTLHHGSVCNLFYSVLVQSVSGPRRRKLACSFEFGYCLMLGPLPAAEPHDQQEERPALCLFCLQYSLPGCGPGFHAYCGDPTPGQVEVQLSKGLAELCRTCPSAEVVS